MREPEYVPRRLSHPSNRPAQAPSPVRASQMMSPVGRRTSPSTMIRKPLRSPQTIVFKRKQSSPQQIVPDAIESSPVSPLPIQVITQRRADPKPWWAWWSIESSTDQCRISHVQFPRKKMFGSLAIHLMLLCWWGTQHSHSMGLSVYNRCKMSVGNRKVCVKY
jgi:hypothetical protein